MLASLKSEVVETPETQSTISIRERSNSASHAQLIGMPPMQGKGCSVYDSETTLQEHSVYAAAVLEQAVDKSLFVGQNPEMSAALASLRSIVDHLGTTPNAHQSLSSATSGAGETTSNELHLPWQKDVNDVLARAKISPSILFAKFLPFMTLSQFEEICKDVYQQSGKVGQGRLVIFFSTCYHLATEYSTIQTNHTSVETFQHLAGECRQNLEIALGNLNMLMPATMENVQALLLGVSIAARLFPSVSDDEI